MDQAKWLRIGQEEGWGFNPWTGRKLGEHSTSSNKRAQTGLQILAGSNNRERIIQVQPPSWQKQNRHHSSNRVPQGRTWVDVKPNRSFAYRSGIREQQQQAEQAEETERKVWRRQIVETQLARSSSLTTA